MSSSLHQDSHNISSNSSKREDRDSDNSDSDSDIPFDKEEKRKPSPARKRAPSPKPATPKPIPPPKKTASVLPPKPPKRTEPNIPDHYTVIKKLNGYTELMPHLFTEKEISAWNSGDNNFTEERARKLYADVQNRLNSNAKLDMAEMAFYGICDVTDMAINAFDENGEMTGFGSFVKTQKGEFRDEINELSIEMSDSWLPGARTKMVIKVIKMYHLFKRLRQKDREREMAQEIKKS